MAVTVYPHRLRHTCATQLLNAGCRVTSIQKFLGHKRLNSTMIYARVHDQTVADDYYSAMERVEQRLDIARPAEVPPVESSENERSKKEERKELLDLADQLIDPDLSPEERIELDRMRQILNRDGLPEKESTEQENGRRPRAPPQPSPAFPWVNTV